MKWFKHQSDARNSLKLRKVRRRYGADGYAIYWFCLEAISYDVDKDNLTFELKEDAETIGFELSIQESRVEEIMKYMISLGLFESSANMITCMKLAESIDKSMTNSPKMRKWLEINSSESVMTSSDVVSTCAELEVEVEVEKNKRIDHLAVINESFEFWWADFPTKVSKKKSSDKWVNICKKKTTDQIEELTNTIVEDIANRKAMEVFGFDKMHPTTYLNQERWNDELSN